MDQYPSCLMLNFAMKLISDAGFQTEISTVSSAAQQLDIFSKVLLTSIDAVLFEHRKGYITAAYEKAFGELIRVVCQAEHTYVYTMGLLKAVGSIHGGRILAACEQIADSLRSEMEGREHETTAIRIALVQTVDDQVASHFTQALLNMVSRCELNPADMTIIYDQYILPLPPPISIIRDPIFIELLLDSLFHYEGPKTIAEHRFKYIFLLAFAASVSETISSNGRRTQSRLELDNCRQCLDDTVSLLEGMDDLLVELNELLHAIKMPVVAAGVLYYIQTLLLSEEKTGDPPGAALCLLDHISTLHPNLHTKAFEVCCQLYEKIAAENEAAEVIMERQRLVVDRLVHLLSVGGAIPVLEKVCEMFRNGQIDASLVLEIIAPPFADDLVALFLPLVVDEEVFDKEAQERFPQASEFIQYCRQQMPASLI
ncbi:TH1 protein [Dictyocaulus viviparus]|uniref:TH1 protein n=1 Tax=Dictyocaulus viviparus TaxID=29172 RepID=A0A0D8Y6Z3_DICVI|nr:TH1 protein [Dictyocaulus viviparus]